MPSTITEQFQDFGSQIGLRNEVSSALWNAEIHSPQELAACETEDLKKISSNPLLINFIHPLLQKYLFNITMAKDPFKKAIGILKKHAQRMDDDEEAMDTECADAPADSTVSDAVAFNTPVPGAIHGKTSGPANGASKQANRSSGTQFHNAGVRINTSNNGTVQSNIGFSSGKGDPGNSTSFTISGGNFVQANIMGRGPVIYNNTNTSINTSLQQEAGQDVEKRRAQVLNTHLMIDGRLVRTADIAWNDHEDYWVNEIATPASDYEDYANHLADDDIYNVRNPGSSRALILNNIEFRPGSGMGKRAGADKDCSRIQKLLEDNGFQVCRENNKTAAEMKALLKDFTKSRLNMRADMTVVYIGSHGERDAAGNDTFVGVDGVRVSFKEIRELFSPKNCPALVNKPKIFMLQFCRQESRTGGDAPRQTAAIQGDAGAFGPEQNAPTSIIAQAPSDNETRIMDMLCVYATLAGNKAYRDTLDGSWFVTALIRIISESAHRMDLLSMLTKVNNSVSVNEGKEGQNRAVQVSEVVHNLRKKVFFFPGQAI